MAPIAAHKADASPWGKARRRLARLTHRRPAPRGPKRPTISVSFDDAPATAVEAGARILEARGLRGTYFVSAGLCGREGPMGRFAEVEALQASAAAGHELACHTFSHLDCGPADGDSVAADLERNRAALAGWSVPEAKTFAYPYGDVGFPAKRLTSERFSLSRALHHGLVEAGSDLNQAPAVGIEGPGGGALARRWLARAYARNAWLILYTHDVRETPSPWGCTPDALARLIDEALEDGFEVVTVAEGVRRLAA
jgi:peptidoglycan/xylan/chitin deacetylase (PgdA/CDA1 family)